MNSVWTREIIRILVMLLAVCLVGLWTGFLAGFLIFALASYLAVHLLNLYRLQTWLVSGRARPPEASGIWGEIFHQFYRLQRRNRLRKQRLAQLLREFRSSTAAMPEGVVVMNRDWQIIWFNDAAEQLLGLKVPDAGQHVHNLVRDPAFGRYLQRGNWKEPLAMVSPVNEEQRLTIHLVPYGEGQRLLLVRDSTRLYRLEQMRREFVANASHELRSPLTVINGYLDALAGDPELYAEWRKPIGEMQRQASRMAGIVNDLLELSRLETEGREAGREEIDVRGLMARIREEALAMGEGPTEVRVEYETAARLYGEEREVYSAFSNLVFNAMRYTPENGSVRLVWHERDGGICLSVIDTGIGIAAEHIPRLTERFYRVDQSRVRASGGTGLGLAIVKHVVQRHGGRLQIESRPGKGSTFSCWFPAERIARAA